MICFKDRNYICDRFNEWCMDNKLPQTAHSFIVYATYRGWLNEEKIVKDLKHEKENKKNVETL